MDRPYVLLSCAMSIDGYIDDASDVRLVLSGPEDLDEIDDLRSRSDAILVGAGTVRADNPRLLLRSTERQAVRTARGAPANPVRVVLTATGDLDPSARLFTSADAEPIVYAATPAVAKLANHRAEIIDAGCRLDLAAVLTDLTSRGIDRLMVEGGQSVHTSFLTAGLADELRLAIAPFFVGDPAAPRFVAGGSFPCHPGRPATLTDVRPVGNVAVLTYRLTPPGQS